MRLTRRVSVAVAAVAALLAATTACSSDGGGTTAPKDVEVFTWWADGGEKAGLDGLVSQFNTDCGDFTFVNGAVAGGAGCQRQAGAGLPAAAERPAGHVPGARRRRADRLHQRRPGRGPQRAVPGVGPDQRLPEGPHRQPDRRRQDLLGAGEHPPRQRRCGATRPCWPAPASPRTRRRWTGSSPTWTSSRPRASRRWPWARTGPS